MEHIGGVIGIRSIGRVHSPYEFGVNGFDDGDTFDEHSGLIVAFQHAQTRARHMQSKLDRYHTHLHSGVSAALHQLTAARHAMQRAEPTKHQQRVHNDDDDGDDDRTADAHPTSDRSSTADTTVVAAVASNTAGTMTSSSHAAAPFTTRLALTESIGSYQNVIAPPSLPDTQMNESAVAAATPSKSDTDSALTEARIGVKSTAAAAVTSIDSKFDSVIGANTVTAPAAATVSVGAPAQRDYEMAQTQFDAVARIATPLILLSLDLDPAKLSAARHQLHVMARTAPNTPFVTPNVAVPTASATDTKHGPTSNRNSNGSGDGLVLGRSQSRSGADTTDYTRLAVMQSEPLIRYLMSTEATSQQQRRTIAPGATTAAAAAASTATTGDDASPEWSDAESFTSESHSAIVAGAASAAAGPLRHDPSHQRIKPPADAVLVPPPTYSELIEGCIVLHVALNDANSRIAALTEQCRAVSAPKTSAIIAGQNRGSENELLLLNDQLVRERRRRYRMATKLRLAYEHADKARASDRSLRERAIRCDERERALAQQFALCQSLIAQLAANGAIVAPCAAASAAAPLSPIAATGAALPSIPSSCSLPLIASPSSSALIGLAAAPVGGSSGGGHLASSGAPAPFLPLPFVPYRSMAAVARILYAWRSWLLMPLLVATGFALSRVKHIPSLFRWIERPAAY